MQFLIQFLFIYIRKEEPTYVRTEKRGNIMRRSIFTLFQSYQYFTTTPLILILLFSASILLSQAISTSSSPSLLILHACFNSLFHAIGFPPSSQFLSLLNTNLSQTIFSSVFSLRFALTSLIIAKAFIIQAPTHHESSLPSNFSFKPLYKPLLLTQICNSILIIVANMIAFSYLFLAFHSLAGIGFSINNHPLVLLVAKAVFYSFLANASIICNLALVVAGVENCAGFMAIGKACFMSWTKNSMALAMNFPINLSIIAIEGLFRYRVIKAYHLLGRLGLSVALEGLLISYLYSLLLVLDTIASCLFFKNCKTNFQMDPAGRYYFQIMIIKKEDSNSNANSSPSVNGFVTCNNTKHGHTN